MTVMVSLWMLTTKGIKVDIKRSYRDETDYPTTPFDNSGEKGEKSMDKVLKEDTPKVFVDFLQEFNKEMYGATDQSKQDNTEGTEM